MITLRSTQYVVILVVALLPLDPYICKADEPTRCFLIGNSLTWDTVPSSLDGDTQWHVDCSKSLPYIVEHPEEPCVKTSTLWPAALKDKQYDVISLQVHYGSTLAEDLTAITKLIDIQPNAKVVIHTGWARSAERIAEWTQTQKEAGNESDLMSHNISYFDSLLKALKDKHPTRSFSRTRAMDMLQCVEEDIAAGKAPISNVTDLYRDKIHMNTVTGRYLMHNAMRHALGRPRSAVGFEKLEVEMEAYLESVLNRVLQ